MGAVSVIMLVRCSRCLLVFLGLHGQRLQGSEHGIWFLRLLQFRLGTKERRDEVHGVCVAHYPIEGAEIWAEIYIFRIITDCLTSTEGARTGHHVRGPVEDEQQTAYTTVYVWILLNLKVLILGNWLGNCFLLYSMALALSRSDIINSWCAAKLCWNPRNFI